MCNVFHFIVIRMMLSRGREISLCAVNTCARQWVVLVRRGFILLEVEAWPEAEAFSFVTCTSVLNLKPLPYQTALTKPLMNVEPLTMQKNKTKQKKHTHTHEQVLENPTELDRRQFTPKPLLFLVYLTLIYLTGLIGYSLISIHVEIWSFSWINPCRSQEMI